MNNRIILFAFSICIALLTGCGAQTVHALESVETAEETVTAEYMENIDMSESEPEETTDIADADYISMAKTCEQEFKILDGEKYNCDIAIDIRGCVYVYEFPEEEVRVEDCSLLFGYEEAKINDTSEGKVVEVPVSIMINENSYFIGEADVFLLKDTQTEEDEIDEIVYYYEDEYRKSIDYDLLKAQSDELKAALIRDYNPGDRTVELCYVTAIDCDTYTDYQIEKEEWIKVPLCEEVRIIGWSWGNTAAVHMSEEVFDDYVEGYLDNGYFFATIYEKEESALGIVQVFNP